LCGGLLALIGAILLIANAYGALLPWGWIGYPALTVGLAGLLFHAAMDKEQLVRRLYGVFAVLWFVAGVVLAVVPYKGAVGGLFLQGFLCMGTALLFGLASLRNEADKQWRELAINIVGGAGALMALTGFIMGLIRADLLMPYGVLLAPLGLCYLWAFIRSR